MKKTIIWFLVGVTVLGAGYYFYKKSKKKIKTKAEAIDYLVLMRGLERASIEAWDEDYLVARANATASSTPTFKVGTKTYSTATGKVIAA